MRSILYFYRMSLPSSRAHAIQVLRSAEAMAAAGASVTLVVRRDREAPIEPGQFIGAELAPRLRLVTFGWRRKAVWPITWRLVLWRLFSFGSVRPVVYLRQVEHYAAKAAALARRLGLPVLYEAHNIKTAVEEETGGAGATAFWEPTERSLFASATGVVFTSEHAQSMARERFGWSGPSIVEPNASPGVDPPGPQSAPAVFDTDEPSRVLESLPESVEILYVGQLYPWKGVDLLLEALTHLPGRRLTIAGGIETDDLERTRATAVRLGVANRVTFLGQIPTPAVPVLMRRARVGAIPLPGTGSVEARLFTAPLKLFEFWAAGVPVVASDLPSIRALVKHGETGVLVAPDARSLAAGLARVLEDRELGARLAETGRREAASRTWDARARRILDFIERIPS